MNLENDSLKQRRVANELLDQAAALGSGGDPSAALGVYNEIIGRFATAPDVDVRTAVGRALVERGIILSSGVGTEVAIRSIENGVEHVAGIESVSGYEVLASALYNKATIYRMAGEHDMAIALFDELVQRFGGSDDETLRRWVMLTLYNLGMALYSNGVSRLKTSASSASLLLPVPDQQLFRAALERSVLVFDDLTRRFGGDMDLTVAERVARGGNTRAHALALLGRNDEAIVGFDDVIQRFGDAANPSLQLEIATALRRKGDNLHHVGRATEAAETLAMVLERYDGSTDPDVQQVVDAVRLDKATLIGIGRPAEHGKSDPYEVSIYREFIWEWRRRLVLPAIPLVVAVLTVTVIAPARSRDGILGRLGILVACAGFWGFHLRRGLVSLHYAKTARKLSQARERQRGESHNRAVAVYQACKASHGPLGLYLRNFELEVYSRPAREGSRERMMHVSNVRGSAVERELAAALANRVPILAISNPRAVIGHGEVIPRLALAGDFWTRALEDLIRMASLIVVEFDTASPGMQVELRAILELGKQDVTVIIVNDSDDDPLISALEDYFAVEEAPSASREDLLAELGTAFPRIIGQRDVPWQDLDSCSAFAGLVGIPDGVART